MNSGLDPAEIPSPTHVLTIPQFQHLFDSLLALVFTLDATGKFQYISGSSLAILGFRPEELQQTSCFDRCPDHYRLRTEQFLHQLVSGTPIIHFENEFFHKDGHLVPLSWASRWDETDQKLYCVVRDITERKKLAQLQQQHQAELQLRNQEMTDMLERIADGFCVLDKNWRFTYINGQAEKIVGLPIDQVLYHTLWECFPATKGTAFEMEFRRSFTEQVPVHFESYYPAPLDQWFEMSVYPSPSGISIFFRDVSERKKAEAERLAFESKLEAQHQQLVNTLDRMNQGFISFDQNYQITHWNSRAEEISGVPARHAISANIIEMMTDEAKACYFPLYEHVIATGMAVNREIHCPQLLHWIELNIYPQEGGCAVFFKDISERKIAEEELRKLSLIAQETSNAVIITDINKNTTWVNHAFENISGFSLREAVGKNLGQLLNGPETDMQTVHYIDRQRKKHLPYHTEILNYRKDGLPFWMEVHGQPLFNEGGTVTHYFSIETDITERKKLQLELEQQHKQMQAAVIAAQEKERAHVGKELHDNVNQVLTTVKLYQELCLSGIDNSKELIEKSMKLLQESINEIRSLSKRLSAPTLGNIRLKDSIKELADAVGATNKIAVQFHFTGNDNERIDEALHLAIYRILQEQITNVLKHAQAKNLEIRMELKANCLCLKVTDDGCGFDLGQKSNGIGMTNMKSRAEALKGNLRWISRPGHGCTMQGFFPLQAWQQT